MNEMLTFYQQQARAHVAVVPWLTQVQEQALLKLEQLGLPTRHHEEWKYTSVDGLLKQAFNLATPSVSLDVSIPEPLASMTQQLVIQQGVVTRSLLNGLPPGVLVIPLATALIEHEALVRPYLAKILQEEHGFQALNTAFIHHGVFIYIPKGVHVEMPIVLVHRQDHGQEVVYLRHLIVAEEGSQCTVVEDYSTSAHDVCLTNTVTEIVVGAHAQLTHYKIQRDSKSSFHLGHIAVRQDAHSNFASHSLSLGGAVVRSDLSLFLQQEQARCLMNGIYAPTEGQHVDHHTCVQHLVPSCSSEQDYKGIVQGKARAVFNGKVIVAPQAQHTNAQQQNKNLLLSAQAEIDTKPQLEIFADDVICAHGATVGQLDEDALFYLASRGIGRLEATHYLIHAFAQDNIRLIPHRELADWMSDLLIQQLG